MSNESGAIRAAADALHAAHESGRAIPPIAGSLGAGADAATAYAVQETNTRRWIDAGRRLVGRKIGLTAPAVQAQLGVNEPDYGMLYADMELADGEALEAGSLIAPKVEAELAFVLGRDLPDPDCTPLEVLRAVDCVLPAIEIVDSRIADWKIALLDTIADNASSARYVIGNRPVRPSDIDPARCRMTMTRAGETVAEGEGAACLGNPLVALRWLARTMARAERPMHAGDVVLSGALGPMVPARPGDDFDVRIDGAGAVRIRFTD